MAKRKKKVPLPKRKGLSKAQLHRFARQATMRNILQARGMLNQAKAAKEPSDKLLKLCQVAACLEVAEHFIARQEKLKPGRAR